MKIKLCFVLFFLYSNFIIGQNKIDIEPKYSGSENEWPKFRLNRAKPKIINTNVKILTNTPMQISLINEEDSLRIQYTNIFGQLIDTTYTNAKTLSYIPIYVDKFIDYPEKSIIQNSMENDLEWVLTSYWGHEVFGFEKLVLDPKRDYLKYSYYLNGKKIKKGKIEITQQLIKEIFLFEKKLRLMKNPDGLCNNHHLYRLNSGKDKLEIQDNSCSGFSSEQLLKSLGINISSNGW